MDKLSIVDDVEYNLHIYQEGIVFLKWRHRKRIWASCGLGLTAAALFTSSFVLLSLAICAGLVSAGCHGVSSVYDYDPAKMTAATKCLTE